MKQIFDFDFYISNYPDLNNSIKTEIDGWLHYWKYGIIEDRICKNYLKLIDTDFYINYYKDLLDANITTHKLAIDHWLKYGLFEMRKTFMILELDESFDFFQKNAFPKYLYDPENLNSNLIDYLKRHSLTPNEYQCEFIIKNIYYTLKKNNSIDIDLKLYKFSNKINYNYLYDLLDDFNNNGLNGLIYCKKQLKNIYPSLEIYEFNGVLYCEDIKSPIMRLDEFVRINIYEKSFNEMSDILITQYDNNIESNVKLCVLLFIGNDEKGSIILDKLIEYKMFEIFNLAVCFNSNKSYDSLIHKIKGNFNHYITYVCKEMGNDIVPTILMYHKLIDIYKPEHIIKLQTKSNNVVMNELTDYLLKQPLNNIIRGMPNNSNICGNPKYYINIRDDRFNKDLYNIFKEHININKKFIEGTIFYIHENRFMQILNFIKNNNFKAFLLNNMYDSNRIIFNRSYVHLLERLFGVYI